MHPDDLQNEFDALRPGTATAAGASRRTALKSAAGLAAYASVTLPVVAQTAIHTSADGLDAQWVAYEVAGFSVPAYMAKPAKGANHPVILVVQEIFGVHEYIADVCRRFAALGYLAIAPELYARQGDAKTTTGIPKLMSEIVSKVPDAQVMADLDGALAFAARHGGNTQRAGITGFCWGGRIVWLYAATGKVKAGVAWYGRLVGTASALTPQQPIDIAKELKAPVLGLYGGKDQGIPVTMVNEMQEALTDAGQAGNRAAAASRFVVYPEAGHAFHADYRSSYVASAALDGWSQATAWFKQKL